VAGPITILGADESGHRAAEGKAAKNRFCDERRRRLEFASRSAFLLEKSETR
jgi:hypothetical protein